jgi:hypothetical protein
MWGILKNFPLDKPQEILLAAKKYHIIEKYFIAIIFVFLDFDL